MTHRVNGFTTEANTILYWYPENGIDPNESEITISRNRELVKMIGESNKNPIHNILIKNIEFRNTGRPLFLMRAILPFTSLFYEVIGVFPVRAHYI